MGDVLSLFPPPDLFFSLSSTNDFTELVVYCIRMSDTGCCNSEHIGDISPLKFTGSAASNFGPLSLIYLLVVFTFSEFIFAEISLCFSDWSFCFIFQPEILPHDTL